MYMKLKALRLIQEKSHLFLTILFILVSIFNLILAINHEYWRDEAQAWLIARDCSLTPDSLFTVTSYEGHPLLWFLLLMPFAKFGFPFAGLKYISWGIMTVSLFIFFFNVKLPTLLKAVLALTPAYIYFFVVPARSYSLAGLLIICISATYNRHKDFPVLYSILLSMLLQTLVIMGGFVTALGMAWFIETLISIIKRDTDKIVIIKNIIGLSFLLISALFLLWEFRYTSTTQSNIISLFDFIRKPLGEYKYSFEILFGKAFIPVFLLVHLSFLGLFIINKQSRIPLITIAVGIIWQAFIYAYIYPTGNNRLITWIYLFIFVLIVSYDSNFNYFSLKNIFIITITIALLFSWNYQYSDRLIKDLRKDMVYSYSKNVADAINSLPEDSIILSLSPDIDTSVIVQVDDRHSIYNIFNDKKSTYTDRNPKNSNKMTVSDLFKKIKSQFMDKEQVYAIVSTDKCEIKGMAEYVKESHSDISIVYESPHSFIEEDYLLIAINRN